MRKCPVTRMFHLLGKMWTVPILDEVSRNGGKGYMFMFRRSKRISPKIFSMRLKELEDVLWIGKKEIDAVPKRTSYHITPSVRNALKIAKRIGPAFRCQPSDQKRCGNKGCFNCPKF